MVERWYWCLSHGLAEEGEQCPAKDRLGPYGSAEEAANYAATVDARNEEWDSEDERWEGEQSQA
ncbi:MAG: hypothetical protein H0V19_02030 [Euzebyales bacterium]|nr:hypothetical protein [Euzebyales bacterium]